MKVDAPFSSEVCLGTIYAQLLTMGNANAHAMDG